MKFHAYLRHCWQCMAAGKGKGGFLQGCRPCEATHASAGPTSTHTQSVLREAHGYQRREKTHAMWLNEEEHT